MGFLDTPNAADALPKPKQVSGPPQGDPFSVSGPDIDRLREALVEVHGQSRQVFNVKSHFGARGDNSTDDRAAIQAAIDAAGAAGGGQVFFPPGTYYVSSTVFVNHDEVTLRGASDFGGSILSAKGGAHTVLKIQGVRNDSGSDTYRRKVRVHDLHVLGTMHLYLCVDFAAVGLFVSHGATHSLIVEGGWIFSFTSSRFQHAQGGHNVYLTHDPLADFQETNALDFVTCNIEGGSAGSGVASGSATKIQVLNFLGGVIEGHTGASSWGVDIPYGNSISGVGVYFEGNRAGNVRLGSATTRVDGGTWRGIGNAGYGDGMFAPRPPVGFHLVNAHGVEVQGNHRGFSGPWLLAEPASTRVVGGGHEAAETYNGGSAVATVLGTGQSGIAGVNLARNGGFEKWATASSAVGWVRSQGTETIAQSSTEKNAGDWGISVTNAESSSGGIFQRYTLNIAQLRNRKVFAGVLAKTDLVNRVRVRVSDGIGGSYTSNTHPGGGAWRLLGLEVSVPAGATELIVIFEITTGAVGTAYFDDARVIVDAGLSTDKGVAVSEAIGPLAGTVTTTGAGPTYTATVTHNLDHGSYRVVYGPSMNAAVWTTSKTSAAFTVNSSVAGSIDYFIIPD